MAAVSVSDVTVEEYTMINSSRMIISGTLLGILCMSVTGCGPVDVNIGDPTILAATELKPVCRCDCYIPHETEGVEGTTVEVQFDCANRENCSVYNSDVCETAEGSGTLSECKKVFVAKQ